MQLEDYFNSETYDFDQIGKVEKIRLVGSRIAVEDILEPFLQGESAERIYQGYRNSITLEQVYATITWYLHNKDRADEYLKRGDEVSELFQRQQKEKEIPEPMKRVRMAKAARQSAN